MLAVTIATLTLSGSPPVLKGAHFKPHELVQVLVPGPSGAVTPIGSSALIKVRATGSGTFLIRLPETPQTSRRGVLLRAVGALGSKAQIYRAFPQATATGGVAKAGDPTK